MSSSLAGLAMAAVRPDAEAMARKEAFTHRRSGRPKETFERPTTVRAPKDSAAQRTVRSVSRGASGFEAAVMTMPSTRTSSRVKPCLRASRATARTTSARPSAVSGMPLSVSGSRMNMAPYFAATGRSLRSFSVSPEMELMSARPG